MYSVQKVLALYWYARRDHITASAMQAWLTFAMGASESNFVRKCMVGDDYPIEVESSHLLERHELEVCN
jgi:hypothetical protein